MDLANALRSRSRGLLIGGGAALVLVLAGLPGGAGDGADTLATGAADGSAPTTTSGEPGDTTGEQTPQASNPGAAPSGGAAVPGTPGASGAPAVPGTAAPGGAPGKPSGAAPDGQAPAPQQPRNGRGVSADAIAIGVVYGTNRGAAAAGVGLGGGGGSGPDAKAQAAAVIEHVNGTGGIAGRAVKPIYQEFDYSSRSDQGTVACTRFTQDETVFAVVTGAGANIECLAKKGVVTFAPDFGASVDNYRNFADHLYGPSDFNATRQIQMYVDGWVQSGQLKSPRAGTTSPVKIGVVLFNITYDVVQPVVDAQFSKNGLKVTAYGRVASDSSNIGTIVNDFKAKGITHVMTPGYGPALFMNFAASQAYRPLYGLASSMQPMATASVAPADQLEGSVVVGWRPTDDVGERDRPDLGAKQQLCKQIMAKAAQPFDSVAASFCDLFFALQQSLRTAPAINVQTLRAGYEAVGEYDSVVTFRSLLKAGRLHDGGAGYRLARYVATCTCFRYDGPVRPY